MKIYKVKYQLVHSEDEMNFYLYSIALVTFMKIFTIYYKFQNILTYKNILQD